MALKEFLDRLKTAMTFVKWLIVALVILAVIAGAIWLGARGCHKNAASSSVGKGGASTQGAPPGWSVAPVEETPLIENPLRRSKAGEETKGFPAGSKVVEVETHGEPTVKIGILPGGQVVTEEGHAAQVYFKRPALFALGVDPIVGVGLSAADKFGPGILAGVDVVKIGPARIGAGALVDPLGPVSVAGGATFGADVYKNVGVRGFAGAGNHGWTFGAAATITIK